MADYDKYAPGSPERRAAGLDDWRGLTRDDVVALLRADPELAWYVLQRVHVAGPWERASDHRYKRPCYRRGIVHSHGTTAAALEKADTNARREGYLLAGGIPTDVDSECGEEHDGWPGQSDPEVTPSERFRCDQVAGHLGACSGLGLETGTRLSGRNAMERSR